MSNVVKYFDGAGFNQIIRWLKGTFARFICEPVFINTGSVYPNQGSIFYKNVTYNCTINVSSTTFMNTGNMRAANFTVVLINKGTYTVSWSNNVKWSDSSTAPSINSPGVYVFNFTTIDGGSTYYGTLLVNKAPDTNTVT